jgi:hypothetical protein
MAWIRDGAPPEQVKVTLLVSIKEHPELAKFILSLPYGQTSKILREILSAAVRSAGSTHAAMNRPSGQAAANQQEAASNGNPPAISTLGGNQNAQPGVGEVSAAAVSIIENFDKMFPS